MVIESKIRVVSLATDSDFSAVLFGELQPQIRRIGIRLIAKFFILHKSILADNY